MLKELAQPKQERQYHEKVTKQWRKLPELFSPLHFGNIVRFDFMPKAARPKPSQVSSAAKYERTLYAACDYRRDMSAKCHTSNDRGQRRRANDLQYEIEPESRRPLDPAGSLD